MLSTEVDLELPLTLMARHVISRAVQDARGKLDQSDGDPKMLRLEALAFLYSDRADFKERRLELLRLAGYDAEDFEAAKMRLLSEIPAELLDGVPKLPAHVRYAG